MTTPETPAPLSPHEIVAMRALLDRQAIQDQVARTARGADRFDRDLYLSAFHAGALVSSGGAARPAAEAYDGGRGFHDATTIATLHCLSTANCEIDGDTAHVETYHIYTARNRDDASWAAAGATSIASRNATASGRSPSAAPSSNGREECSPTRWRCSKRSARRSRCSAPREAARTSPTTDR